MHVPGKGTCIPQIFPRVAPNQPILSLIVDSHSCKRIYDPWYPVRQESRFDVNQMLWQFCKFAFVGLLATAIHYSILVFLVEQLRIHVVLSTTLGFGVAATFSYACNRRFTFASNARHAVALPKFLAVGLLGAAMNASIVAWLHAHTSIHYLIAQACATITVLGWNFMANALWTFGRTNRAPHRS